MFMILTKLREGYLSPVKIIHRLSRKYKYLVIGYLSGEISERERDFFEKHLKGCNICLNELKRIRETEKNLSSVFSGAYSQASVTIPEIDLNLHVSVKRKTFKSVFLRPIPVAATIIFFFSIVLGISIFSIFGRKSDLSNIAFDINSDDYYINQILSTEKRTTAATTEDILSEAILTDIEMNISEIVTALMEKEKRSNDDYFLLYNDIFNYFIEKENIIPDDLKIMASESTRYNLIETVAFANTEIYFDYIKNYIE